MTPGLQAISAPCPSGKRVLGGGYSIALPGGGAVTPGPGWLVTLASESRAGGGAWDVRVFAYAAPVSGTTPPQPTTITVNAICANVG